MLDVRRLEVLAAAVRERSLSAAARSLGLTPSAASQAVAALEAQAGTTLLVRQARGVAPTPAGERLALHAETVLSQLAQAELELAHTQPGSLRVAAFPTAVFGLVVGAARDLHAQMPAAKVIVTEHQPDEARAALRAGDVDLALVNHGAWLAPDANGPWRVEHVLDEPVLIALPAHHVLAHRARVDLSRLAGEPWVMQLPASPCQQLTTRACAEAGFAPEVMATCGDYRSITALVAAGHGVALVPKLAVYRLDLEGVVLRPTRSPLARRVNALVPEDRLTPMLTAFLRAVRDRATQL